MKIAVLGAGSWGTTLSIVLYHNGHDITLWEYKKSYARTISKHRENTLFLPGIKIPKEITITASLDKAIENQHMVVLAIPTQFIRSVLKKIPPSEIRDCTFVSVAKGIEKNSHLTVSQIIKDEFKMLDNENIGVLSGPSHAEEVSKKIPTAVVAACSSNDTAEIIQATFMTSYFRVYSSTDVLGVELGGALKNVIAIGAGIVDGAKFGDNTKAAIMTRGIAEISRLGTALGALPKTFAGLSGMGDLIVTCMSRHSRNRYVGDRIGKGEKLKDIINSMKMIAEGVETSKSVYELARKNHIDVPIADAVYNILYNEKDPQKLTYDLMSRDMKPEY
ncbi:NAD(P)H-dependent glycerol-3-phosphate dehydrogenase [Bacteroidota bacterium]